MKKIVSIFVLFCSVALFGQNKNAKHSLEVDGVCGSCKARIEKAAMQVKGVKYAQWNRQNHQLFLVLNERKNPLEQVQKAIAKAGHDNRQADKKNEILATEADYQRISDCCKYRSPEAHNHH